MWVSRWRVESRVSRAWENPGSEVMGKTWINANPRCGVIQVVGKLRVI